jgi:hypothetical protein
MQSRYTDWNRQYVGILQAVPLYGLDALEATQAAAKQLSHIDYLEKLADGEAAFRRDRSIQRTHFYPGAFDAF